jgi:hypothetical protein
MKKILLVVALAAASFSGSLARAESDLPYYQQFPYAKETSDDGDGEVHTQWRWLMGDVNTEIEIDSNKFLLPSVDLFLERDGTFELRYREMYKVRDNANAEWRYQMGGFCPTKVKGSWTVPDQLLVLSDVATGERAVWHTQNAVKLTFARALVDPALAGKSIVLSYGYGMQDKDANQPPFCP